MIYDESKPQEELKQMTVRERMELAIKEADDGYKIRKVQNTQTAFDFHEYRKNHIDEATKIPDTILIGIISGVWRGKSALIVMGTMFDEDSDLDGYLCRLSPIDPDEDLICFNGYLVGGKNITEDYIFYGGSKGVKVEAVIKQGEDNPYTQEKPMLVIHDGLELPDDIQAFLRRGYGKKATVLLHNLCIINDTVKDEIFHTKTVEESEELALSFMPLNPDVFDEKCCIEEFKKMVHSQWEMFRKTVHGEKHKLKQATT